MHHYRPPQTFAAPLLAVNGRAIQRALSVIAAVIIALGLFREGYVAFTGEKGALSAIALFDTDRNFASWFESTALLFAAGMLAFIALQTRREADTDRHRWAVLAALFLLMAVDESVNAHAMLLGPIYASGTYGPVVVAGLPVLATAALVTYLMPMLHRLPRRRAVQFVLCASLIVGGAVVLEAVGSMLVWNYGTAGGAYVAASLAEESMEVAGGAAFCVCLIGYLQERWPMWGIRVV